MQSKASAYNSRGIGLVNSVWQARHGNNLTFFCHLTAFNTGGIVEEYNMREFVQSNKDMVVNAKVCLDNLTVTSWNLMH